MLHLQSHTDSATHFSADYKSNVRQGFTGRRPSELNVSGPEAVCQMNGGWGGVGRGRPRQTVHLRNDGRCYLRGPKGTQPFACPLPSRLGEKKQTNQASKEQNMQICWYCSSLTGGLFVTRMLFRETPEKSSSISSARSCL